MDDALGVRRVEAGADLARHFEGEPDGRRSKFPAAFAQGRALDELHDDVGQLFLAQRPEIRHHDDVGVADPGQHFCLAPEARQPVLTLFGVTGDVEQHDLQRKGLLQLKVGDTKHLAHSALPKQRINPVLSVNHSAEFEQTRSFDIHTKTTHPSQPCGRKRTGTLSQSGM